MRTLLIAALAGIVMTACHSGEPTVNETNPTAVMPDANYDPSQFKANPSPQQGYEITVSVEDAPGPLKAISARASYQADNCRATIDRIAGATGSPSQALDLTFTAIDDTTYTGTVYLDAMKNEDYYGQGVCEWKLVGVGISLKATGADKETDFTMRVSSDQIAKQNSNEVFFRKSYYPNFKGDGLDYPGAKKEEYAQELHGDLFKATLSVKEIK